MTVAFPGLFSYHFFDIHIQSNLGMVVYGIERSYPKVGIGQI